MCGHARQLPIIRRTSGVEDVNLDLRCQPNHPYSILYQAKNLFAQYFVAFPSKGKYLYYCPA